ncbi:hypothetical protein CH373_03025 [Leptospira perolatii]|uniref:Lipoprotein n=1 Tax=Leptospira perolatii TaxID=2023191 RepID=A0A2M9ZSL5_9LEPT|nr:hypothetical protein [Leptospira perolatii]PJZ71479.1 hypothetical protein CH360_03020 [Leptospira perolatii]PJZ75014.1 hypothetical protein CH373_03025 [Leptospira perolatii]
MKKTLLLLPILAALLWSCGDEKKTDNTALFVALTGALPHSIEIFKSTTSVNNSASISVTVYSGQGCTGTVIVAPFTMTDASNTTTVQVPANAVYSIRAIDSGQIETPICGNSTDASNVRPGGTSTCQIISAAINC